MVGGGSGCDLSHRDNHGLGSALGGLPTVLEPESLSARCAAEERLVE